MPKHLLSRGVPRTLIAAALMLAVAGPAAAKVVYRWKTDDGVYAFTDDAKRIPEKYRSAAKASPLRPLQSYKHYTPAQRSGTTAHVRQMQKTAQDLRAINQRVYGQPNVTVEQVYGAPSNEAVLRTGTTGQSTIEIQSGDESGEPIVSTQRRYYVPGLNSTRTDTVVTQGDRIIAVVKPLPNQDNISTIGSESELP
jgi:hypothetical protein